MAPPVVIKYTTSGVPELYEQLRKADVKIARQAMRKAIAKSLKPILADAKANVAEDTGTLKEALGQKIKAYKGGLSVTGIAGPRYDKVSKRSKKPPKPKKFARVVQRGGKSVELIPAKYAHLVEKGTRPHALGKGSQIPSTNEARRARQKNLSQTGRIHPGAKAQPFMGPALQKNKTLLNAEMTHFLKAAIEALRKT